MKRNIRMKWILAAAVLTAASAAHAQGLEPGEWKFDSVMSSAMLPKPQASSFQRCIKKEDAEDPSKWSGKQQDKDCKVTPVKRTSDSYSWQIDCPKSKMKGTGSARYGKGQMESEQKMSGAMEGQKFEMQVKMSGKRLGACKT
jgi:hypothetical protein